MLRCEANDKLGRRCKKCVQQGSRLCVLHAKMQEHTHMHGEEDNIPEFAPAVPPVAAPAMAPVQDMTDANIIE